HAEGGTTRLVIWQEEKTWRIQAWGRCSPTDCDWGKVELKCLGDHASDPVAKYGLAHWDKGFSDTYMTLRLEKEKLRAETFTCFKDKSGRSDYRSECVLTQPGLNHAANSPALLAEVNDPGQDSKSRTFLEVLAVDPPSPAKLKAGQKANVKIRYQCATAE